MNNGEVLSMLKFVRTVFKANPLRGIRDLKLILSAEFHQLAPSVQVLKYEIFALMCVQAVVVLSGKRKSGKDYIACKIKEAFGSDCIICRLSEPIKREFAKAHGLDFSKLLDSSFYKEIYRSDMIKWGAVKRKEDPYVFVELAVAEALKGRYKVWLFSDARRINDLLYFRRKYKQKCFSVRVICSEEERINRGYIFTEGVDDCESECGLDNINDWDFVFINDKEHDFQKQIEDLLLIIGKRIS